MKIQKILPFMDFGVAFGFWLSLFSVFIFSLAGQQNFSVPVLYHLLGILRYTTLAEFFLGSMACVVLILTPQRVFYQRQKVAFYLLATFVALSLSFLYPIIQFFSIDL